MAGSGDLKYRVTTDGADTIIELNGSIEGEFPDLARQLEQSVNTSTATFDCEKIAKINSVGVKNWIIFLDKVSRKFRFSFRRCSSEFVDMAIMVPAFTQGAKIESFYAVYMCEDCNVTSHQLVEIRNGEASIPPGQPCSRCGQPMTPDDDLESDIECLMSVR